MITIKQYDLRCAFETEKNLLIFSGFYPRKPTTNIILYYFCAFMHLLISWLILLSMILLMIFQYDDLSKLTEALLFFMTQISFLCKLTNFMYHKNNLNLIEEMLEDPVFYGYTLDQLKILTSAIRNADVVARIFRILCILVVISYGVFPFVDKNPDIPLPLPGWLPYDIQTSRWKYYATAIFQVLSIAVSAYNNSSIDLITVKLITLASSLFEILKDNLNNMNYRSHNLQRSKEIRKELRQLIVFHDSILLLIQRIEETFSYGIFVQFVASVFVICFTGFQLIVVPPDSGQFILLILYFSCMMNQVIMYCWYGHDIMSKSGDVGRACYMSNWDESDIAVRKTLFVLFERCKRPVTLTAGNFFTLTLQTLTLILRSAYSYFAVLQRIYRV